MPFGNSLAYDAGFYRQLNSDLSGSDAQLAAHWFIHGIDEGRQACSAFSSRAYLTRYPDLAAALGSRNYRGAIDNYVRSGYSAGRSGN
jgi:hypothetical protein